MKRRKYNKRTPNLHTEEFRPLRGPYPTRPWAVVREIVKQYGSAQKAVIELTPEEYLMATNREMCGRSL